MNVLAVILPLITVVVPFKPSLPYVKKPKTLELPLVRVKRMAKPQR